MGYLETTKSSYRNWVWNAGISHFSGVNNSCTSIPSQPRQQSWLWNTKNLIIWKSTQLITTYISFSRENPPKYSFQHFQQSWTDFPLVDKDSNLLSFLIRSFFYFWIMVWLRFLWEHRTRRSHHQCSILQFNVFNFTFTPAPPCKFLRVFSKIMQDKGYDWPILSFSHHMDSTDCKQVIEPALGSRKEILSLGPTFYIEKFLKDCGHEVLGVKDWTFPSKVHSRQQPGKKWLPMDCTEHQS